jgi:hypothetical protein
VTAEKANLRLLATLPLDPQMVRSGDAGDTGFLDNPEFPSTREFNTLVDEILRLTERGSSSGA